MDNNIYAIHSVMQKMKDDNRNIFFELSHLIVEFQKKTGEAFLIVSEDQADLLTDISSIDKSHYSDLADIYGTYAVFNEIKKITGRTTKVTKLNASINEQLSCAESGDELKKIFNVCIIMNLLRKRLKKNTLEEVNEYKLISKLKKIHPNLDDWLGLNNLSTVETDEQYENFVKNEYTTYNNISFEDIYTVYETSYQHIYDLIYLFQ